MSSNMSRRELIQKSLAGFGAISLPIGLTACGGSGSEGTQSSFIPTVKAGFQHGIASGDPLQDRVILWTRLTPEDTSARLEVGWEIATDRDFRNVINSGKVLTTQAQDFTIKVDADGLLPAQTYFYRFTYGDIISPIGRTKTLPETTDLVRFAVCSCSNYPAGYFYVYREIAKQEVDVVLHLGDYIYEYGQGGYATEDAEKMDRLFAADNTREIIQLDDYRRRYALYRTDEDLQAVHQRHPFIVIWDDHEVANDTWKEGAQNHQSDEGNFDERKLAALQAYFEWMPIRPIAENDHLHIYRQFNFGSLVQLTMLDTRILARDEQLNYVDYATSTGDLDRDRFMKDLKDPSRTMMGYEQRDWLLEKIEQADAVWNVLGQQVLMGRISFPQELMIPLYKVINAGDTSPEVVGAARNELIPKVAQLLYFKNLQKLGLPIILPWNRDRINNVAPYNLDAWDGYYAEREIIFNKLKSLNKKMVVLAGDSHNSWHINLHTEAGDYVGVELGTTSVTSPGIEKYVGANSDLVENIAESVIKLFAEDVKYTNLRYRGYLKVSFMPDVMQSEWIHINTVKDKQYQVVDAQHGYRVSYDTQLAETEFVEQVKPTV
ncbi:alkaline phosphatase D family protein [Acinetobacter sp. WZC-1]|uniref:alkaline phosphatase D family protein n=1 Tax=Acinetobacter sp. WZC-1 TaxID=3459034 RepID=UPI00403D5B73